MTVSTKTYRVNEVFYSLQGEGVRSGTANVFVRFSGCNLACDVEPGPKSPGGFSCDTEFVSGVGMTLEELRDRIVETVANAAAVDIPYDEWNHISDIPMFREHPLWLILTGGEPALQVDKEFIDYFHSTGCKLAIETNGSIALPTYTADPNSIAHGGETDFELALNNQLLDWVCVSPKVAEHAVKQRFAHEVKYVRGYGQGIPKPTCQAEHYLLSPAFKGDQIDPSALAWCIKLCLENPQWRLSTQLHKAWRVR